MQRLFALNAQSKVGTAEPAIFNNETKIKCKAKKKLTMFEYN